MIKLKTVMKEATYGSKFGFSGAELKNESLYDVYSKVDKADQPAFWEYLEELVEKEHGTVADFIYDFLVRRDI